MSLGLQIQLFGSPKILRSEGPLPSFPTLKSRELFSYLAVHPNRDHSRAMLAGLLWPEKTEEKARASLSTELWRLRRVLESFQDHLTLARDEVGLKIESVQVDVLLFRDLTQKPDFSSLTQAVELYKGDFLEGCYSDWCLLLREQLRDSFLMTLEKLLHYHEAHGNWAEAISHARVLIGHDPLREELHRSLMKLYLGIGERSAAAAQYQNCADLLMRELGIQPMPETQAVFKQIKAASTTDTFWPERLTTAQEMTRRKLAELKRSNRYLPNVFTDRPELDMLADEFIHSQAGGFVLVGPSGYGKTTWLAHLAEDRIEKGDPVLFYDAGSLTLTFERDLTRQIWGSESALSAPEAILALSREARNHERLLWIFVDDLNSFHDLGAAPADLLRRLDRILSFQELQNAMQAGQCSLKMIIACRDHTWRRISDEGLATISWDNYFMNQPIHLARFTQLELNKALRSYSDHFDIDFLAQDATADARALLSHPLLLRLMAEIWRGKVVPAFHSELALFRQYVSKAIPQGFARQALNQLIRWMTEKRRTTAHLSDLAFVVQFQRDDAVSQLLDSGILISTERGLDQVIRFSHDRLFEYLLAEHLLVELEKRGDSNILMEHARQADEFPPLRGAVTLALALHHEAAMFQSFALSHLAGIREICTDALITLYGEDAPLAISLSKQIMVLDSLDAKRMVLRAVPFMGAAGYDIFHSAIESPSETVHRVALIALDRLWRRDSSLAVTIMNRLIEEVKPQTVLTAPRKIQTLLRIIGWFSNYGMPPPVMDEIDSLAHLLAVEKLKLPTSESQGRLWPLVKRILSSNTVSWPSNEESVHEIVRPDSLGEDEKNAFRRVLSTLRLGEGGLDDVAIEDIRTLLQSRIDPARYPAHHQLAVWLHHRPSEAAKAIETIYDELDGHTRLWVIMAFLPSSIPPVAPFPNESLDLLEEFTTRLAEENEDTFLEGAERGALHALSGISFLSLGIRYIQMGRTELPFMAASLALSKQEPQKYFSTLRLLAPLGWFYPREVLNFLGGVVDFSMPLDSRLLETFADIHAFHPEIAGAFLQQFDTDETVRHRARLSVNLEQLAYRARILSTQDVRITSILLGSPYGRWLTDCVMPGYLDSRTPKEAARQFGEGLFETLHQCDWHLKRVFGILD